MKTILILLMFFFVGCKPLQTVQTKQYSDTIVADSTITQVVKKELQKQLTEINTTIVEFDVVDNGNKSTNNGNFTVVVANDKPIEVKQPIKRIIKTEIVQKIDNVIEIDSTERKQVHTVDKTQTEVKTEEKTSNFVRGAWAIAIIVLVLLIALCIIKWG